LEPAAASLSAATMASRISSTCCCRRNSNNLLVKHYNILMLLAGFLCSCSTSHAPPHQCMRTQTLPALVVASSQDQDAQDRELTALAPRSCCCISSRGPAYKLLTLR
jgi:hypothetical protein